MSSAPANTLPKEERLCGKSNISALVSCGKWGSTAHLKYCWHSAREEGAGRILVSVPKRCFRRAVLRNLMKRRLREAYRLQKHLLTAPGTDFMLVWTCREPAGFETVRSEVATVLARISKAALQQ